MDEDQSEMQHAVEVLDARHGRSWTVRPNGRKGFRVEGYISGFRIHYSTESTARDAILDAVFQIENELGTGEG